MFSHSGLWSVSRIATGVAAILLLLSVAAVGGTISGNVSDAGNGRGLLGATVTVSATDHAIEPLQTATDESGWFEFKNLPPGSYTVSVTFVGFAPQATVKTLTSESAAETLDIDLQPSLLNFGSMSITASRTPEKTVEAPASVSVVDAESIEERSALTPTEHIKGLPAVDVASTGLNQSNAVVRGFNNIFSGALLVLTDDRIARVPSLRFNAYNFIPTINEDIERVEIVSGPGSALYGPNTASGVMHIITKSPFTSQGTTVSLGGGERSLGLASFRHAGSYENRIGYKVSGQYYRGDDWESHDPSEPDTIQKVRLSASGIEPIGVKVPNGRDFDLERWTGDGRVDFLLGDNASLRLNAGFNRASSIELTGLGAGQAIDWTYSYFQTRFKYKDLFLQGFVNMSDAGDTYLLTSGQLIVDKSRLWVGQVQHSYAPSDRLAFTYGLDALFTRPNTGGTINGRNEDDDDIDEYGAYLQSDLRVSDQLKLVAAARVDDNNRLEDLVFSPRAAAVYQPNPDHNFRATYNRAYSTPDNNNLYLDILQAPDVFGIGEAFGPSFPFDVGVDLRVQGVPESGFHWRMGEEGPAFRSTFAPALGLTSSDYIEFNDPVFTSGVMWGTGRGAVLAGMPQALQPAVNSVVPAQVAGVGNALKTLDPDTQDFVASSVDDIADIERLKPTITQTFELGYKGQLSSRFSFAVDLYRTNKDNFIGPLTVETPNVFLDQASLMTSLLPEIQANYDAADAQTQAALDQLDLVAAGGNGNGTPADELAYVFASEASKIPFGTASPEEALEPDAVLVTYRNFGDVSFYGADLAFAYHLHRDWNIGGTYSYISKNFFAKSASQVHDINLNAPKNKFGLHLRYTNQELGLTAQTRVRWVDAFEMDSPFYGSTVESYTVVDLVGAIGLWEAAKLSLTVQNLLDNRHIEFVGGPEIGRLAIVRVTQTF